jgi:hypothetical protein
VGPVPGTRTSKNSGDNETASVDMGLVAEGAQQLIKHLGCAMEWASFSQISANFLRHMQHSRAMLNCPGFLKIFSTTQS